MKNKVWAYLPYNVAQETEFLMLENYAVIKFWKKSSPVLPKTSTFFVYQIFVKSQHQVFEYDTAHIYMHSRGHTNVFTAASFALTRFCTVAPVIFKCFVKDKTSKKSEAALVLSQQLCDDCISSFSRTLN